MTKIFPPSGFLMPGDIWDTTVKNWSFIDNGKFDLRLAKVATHLPFAEQDTINRVTNYVQDIIDRARTGELTLDEACKYVDFHAVFTKEEEFCILRNRQENGPMMLKFFKEQNGNKPV